MAFNMTRNLLFSIGQMLTLQLENRLASVLWLTLQWAKQTVVLDRVADAIYAKVEAKPKI